MGFNIIINECAHELFPMEFTESGKLILKLMAIIITNLFAAIAAAAISHHKYKQPLLQCTANYDTVHVMWCAIANYFVRSNAIDYSVAINNNNNQWIGNGHICTRNYMVSVVHLIWARVMVVVSTRVQVLFY